MKYTIWKVDPRDSDLRERFGIYYVVNNMYIGYIDFNHFSRLEDPYYGIMEKLREDRRVYQPIASIIATATYNPKEATKLLEAFTADPPKKRLTKKQADYLIGDCGMRRIENGKWQEVYYPNPNFSKTELREVDV